MSENTANASFMEKRTWSRFTPMERTARFLFYFVTVAAIVVSAQTIEIIPEFLMDAPEQIGDMFNRMWPPALSYYPDSIHEALLETIHIATLGTLIALILAVPVGVMVAENVTKNKFLNWFGRLILVSSRSINSLVWALLFVAILGPGPLAGAFAIAFRSVGFVGKLFGEALEESHKGPIEALEASGSPWFSTMMMGYWPQVLPTFWSVALFRWDINLRESAVLGLVGAGGIGVALNTALELFYWDRVAMVLISMLVVVGLVELLVTQIRKRII
ncbi:phosphonate ABC transporter, permease protein PhnE [Sneathiella chinensis]|uniref:Phosphonate ABC transporter, permease protein PhnE n=1 Tax=Sneathiella chinensis TaxID=349750 RepID=A0ABQ5U5D9_9PROT|nr:phosphonate ABC transporter, permease protein PhnE [Sneathiella chinensis]GLQ06489.1 phosphonate ABC transporter, permease protein PhnE [Sneathiella chinensis]